MGFPLPTLDGLTVMNPHVLYNDGYITISSDFTYSPPPPKRGEELMVWNCNMEGHRQMCTRIHQTVLTEKTVFWAEVQDVSSGAVVRGFDSDTPDNAVTLAIAAFNVNKVA